MRNVLTFIKYSFFEAIIPFSIAFGFCLMNFYMDKTTDDIFYLLRQVVDSLSVTIITAYSVKMFSKQFGSIRIKVLFGTVLVYLFIYVICRLNWNLATTNVVVCSLLVALIVYIIFSFRKDDMNDGVNSLLRKKERK